MNSDTFDKLCENVLVIFFKYPIILLSLTAVLNSSSISYCNEHNTDKLN